MNSKKRRITTASTKTTPTQRDDHSAGDALGRRLMQNADSLAAKLLNFPDRNDKRAVVRASVKMMTDGLKLSPIARPYDDQG